MTSTVSSVQTQRTSFSLLTEPWIPVVFQSLEYDLVSLKDLFLNWNEIKTVQAANPPRTIALWRWLIAFTQWSIQGPATVSDWAALWNDQELGQRIVEKLETVNDRLDLLHPKYPFAQCLELVSKSSVENPPSSAEKLVFQDENKGLLWGHYNRWRPALLSYSEAIQELLRLQCCDLGGTKNDGPGATQGNCVLGRIVLPLGDSLRKSLLLNLHQYSPSNDIPSKFTNGDFPLWLHESIEEKPRQPSGLLDYLTYPNRRIFLIQDGSHVVGACIYRGQKTYGSTEPWELWQAYDDRGETLKLDYRKSSWRDAEALLHPTKDKAHKPKIFDWLTKCRKTGFVPNPLSVQVLGFAWEGKAGKPGHWVHDTMTIPQIFLDSEEAYYTLVRALKYSEAVGELFSAKTYAPVADALRLASKPQQKDDDRRRFIRNISSISSSYWSALDAEFQQFMFDLAEGEVDEDDEITYGGKTIPIWKDKLREIATGFYEQSLSGVSSYEARARGLNVWDRELRKVMEK